LAGHVVGRGRGEAYPGFRWGNWGKETSWETQA